MNAFTGTKKRISEQPKALRKENRDFEKELAEHRGLKEFHIYGVRVFALNQKNAERKAVKILEIIQEGKDKELFKELFKELSEDIAQLINNF